jgi:hypothetical protein
MGQIYRFPQYYVTSYSRVIHGRAVPVKLSGDEHDYAACVHSAQNYAAVT